MKRLFLITAAGIVLQMLSCKSDNPFTIVNVEGGKVEGVVANGITVFKGIPFAAPPVGDLRWRVPQPVISWDSVRRADRFGPSCPQTTFSGFSLGNFSEDCLYLNVWTPAKSPDEKLPVMVWIYGGGFSMGSASTPVYSGEELARMGVVYVSLSYRVGPLGFMAHPELTAESENHVSGNYGLLDQIAGLNWVRNNISAFGGDPSRVTIFGESAGAISVSMLAASPLAKGLFSGAISQSGGSFGPVKLDREIDCMQLLEGAEKTGIEFMERMGASSIAELRNIPPEKWATDPLAQMGGFWPVVDGYVITGDQCELYEAGNYNDIPVIIGTNSDEGSMFVRPATADEFISYVQERFGPVAEKILEHYPIDPVTGTTRPQADLFRETVFAWPSWVWARLQKQTGKSKVFVYYFDQFRAEPAVPDGPVPAGAAHGAEIRYVFGHLELDPLETATDEEKKLSETMMKYWTNFAKNGDPNGAGLPGWPEFSEAGETVMHLRGRPHTGPVANPEKLKVIDEYFAWKRSN